MVGRLEHDVMIPRIAQGGGWQNHVALVDAYNRAL
jgi:hypothetical protein